MTSQRLRELNKAMKQEMEPWWKAYETVERIDEMVQGGWASEAETKAAEIIRKDEALLRQALDALDREDRISKYPNNKVIRTALRERLGEKA